MYKGCVYVFHRKWLPVLLISVILSSLQQPLWLEVAAPKFSLIFSLDMDSVRQDMDS